MIGNIKKFRLNQFMSTDFPTFDLICDCAFDSDNGNVSSHLSREAVASETYRGDRKLVPALKYSESFNFQMTLMRDDFEDFDDEEQRKILSWLTQKNAPSMIDFYDDIDSNAITFSILGYVSEIETYKITNNRTIGYIVTFESLNPWVLSPLQTLTKIITTPETFTIQCVTDDYESPIYPKILIEQGNNIVVQADHAMTNRAEHLDGTVYLYNGTYYWVDGNEVHQAQSYNSSGINTTSVLIQNITTNTDTKIVGNVINEDVTLDGANKIISSSLVNGRIFGDDFNWKWMPLIKGNNSIKITGNCTVTLTWRYPIKLGEF